MQIQQVKLEHTEKQINKKKQCLNYRYEEKFKVKTKKDQAQFGEDSNLNKQSIGLINSFSQTQENQGKINAIRNTIRIITLIDDRQRIKRRCLKSIINKDNSYRKQFRRRLNSQKKSITQQKYQNEISNTEQENINEFLISFMQKEKCVGCCKYFQQQQDLSKNKQSYMVMKFEKNQSHNCLNIMIRLNSLASQGGGILLIQGEESYKIWGIKLNKDEQQWWKAKVEQLMQNSFRNGEILESKVDFPPVITELQELQNYKQHTFRNVVIRIYIKPSKTTLYTTKILNRTNQVHQFLYIVKNPLTYSELKPNSIYSTIQKLASLKNIFPYSSSPYCTKHTKNQKCIQIIHSPQILSRQILNLPPNVKYTNNCIVIINSVNNEQISLNYINSLLELNNHRYQISLPYEKQSDPCKKIYFISCYQKIEHLYSLLKNNDKDKDESIIKGYHVINISKICCIKVTERQQQVEFKIYEQKFQNIFKQRVDCHIKPENKEQNKIYIECKSIEQSTYTYIAFQKMNIQVRFTKQKEYY